MLNKLSIVLYSPRAYDDEPIKSLLSFCIYKPSPEKLQNVLREYFCDRQLYLGIIDGRVVACVGCHFFPESKSYKILHLAVSPEYRNQGIAKQMIEWLTLSCDYKQIEAQTDDEGLGFYNACGFSIQSLGKLYPDQNRYQCTKRVS